MKREDMGVLSRDEQAHVLRDADRLAWLDAHRAYIEVGKTGAAGSGYLSFDGEAWEARVKKNDDSTYAEVARGSTQREALDALIEALR